MGVYITSVLMQYSRFLLSSKTDTEQLCRVFFITASLYCTEPEFASQILILTKSSFTKTVVWLGFMDTMGRCNLHLLKESCSLSCLRYFSNQKKKTFWKASGFSGFAYKALNTVSHVLFLWDMTSNVTKGNNSMI